MKVLQLLRRYALGNPLGRIVTAALVLALVAGFLAWIGNPYAPSESSGTPASGGWTAPTTPPLTSAVAPPPPGFPSMTYPPPMPAPEGQVQEVPTRYGVSYDVPADNRWMASNSLVFGWSDSAGSIATYGAGSRYGYGFCSDNGTASLAQVGLTGRNAVDLDTAAREEVAKAERIFADEETGRKPLVHITGPAALDIPNGPAVRYTATLTDVPGDDACRSAEWVVDVVATSGYSNAETVLLVVLRQQAQPDSLSPATAESIVTSIRRTE